MSVQGIILIDLMSLGFIALIVNLVRIRKLHVGYAIVWLLAVVSLMVMVSSPPLLAMVTTGLGAIFPASALTLLAFVFIFFVLVFMSVKLSILSEQVVKIAQSVALAESARKQEATPGNESSNEQRPLGNVPQHQQS